MNRRRRSGRNLVLSLAGMLLILGGMDAPGAILLVTNTNDSGLGSLRQAILLANTVPGLDTIQFNIPGTAPFTIQLQSKLAQITDPIVIDGTSQPGFVNNPVIELDGTSAGDGSGLEINAGNCTVRSLAIHSFKKDGIKLNNVGGNVIDGCFIGTDTTGTNALGNDQYGVEVLSDTNVIGETAGNIISDSGNYGIRIENANGTVIQGNLIGTDITGTNSLGNAKDGIYINGAIGTLVGGTNNVLGNTIAFNNGVGVAVNNDKAANNAVLGNSIFLNSSLGIDLKINGVTPNDAGDKDKGPNNLQNFPLLSQASTFTNTIVEGILSSQSNTVYRLEFFANTACDPSGYGEGEMLVGETNVTTGASGSTNFTVAFLTLVSTGLYITATATDPFNNTSEFSPCVLVTPAGTPSADLSLGWIVSPDPVNVTSNFTYVFTVSNNGPLPATGLSFSNTLPAGVALLSTSASAGSSTNIGNAVTWSLATMASGGSAVITINAVAPSTPGLLTNTAIAGAAELDPAPADNTAYAVVTVVDTESPTITAPPSVITNTDTGECFATTVALGSPTTADNVAVASVVNDAPLPFPKGTNTVTWTVTDTSGNTAMATQLVTVVDNELPTIVAPSDVTVNTDVGKSYASAVALGSPTTGDNCGVASVTNNAPTQFALGTNTVTWTVTDTAGNNATADQNVIVQDIEPPTITAPANVTVNTEACTNYATGVVLGNPVTADNCGLTSVTNNAPTQFALGTSTVTWTVTDTSGNTASAAQTVTVTGPITGVADLTGSWVATKFARPSISFAHGRFYILGYFEVVNNGTAKTGRCRVDYYRSTDPVFDAGDTLIKTKTLKALAPGKSIRQLFGIRTAAGDNPTGEYLIAVIDADNAQAESCKANNVIVDAPLQ